MGTVTTQWLDSELLSSQWRYVSDGIATVVNCRQHGDR